MTARSTLLTTALIALLMGGVFRSLQPTDAVYPARGHQHASASAAPSASRPTPLSTPRSSAAVERLEQLGEAVRILPSDNAAIAEQIALRQLADGRDLPLDERQWAAFASVVAHYQTVRQAYEASIAEVTPLAAGQAQVVIPAYPETGDVLRLKLIAAMASALGAETAHAVVEQLGEALDGYFAGFGVSTQTLDFAAQSARPNDYLITRTATYWNSAKDQPELTTRQESHWPDEQDGSALRWQPFFALLAPDAASNHRS